MMTTINKGAKKTNLVVININLEFVCETIILIWLYIMLKLVAWLIR